MTIKYIYIDDQPESAAKPYARGLEMHEKDLLVQHQQPIEFSAQLRNLRQEDFDGLILDLRLDELKNSTGEVTEYRATALAQELRTRATEKRIKDVPIALLSTDVKFKASFERDDTSHDLFDAVYTKESVLEAGANISQELVCLAKGYKKIDETKGTNRDFVLGLLSLEAENFKFVDPRLGSEFEGERRRFPVHEYARFILRYMLKTSGPLVCEKVLGARLGVDIEGSEDWEKLRDKYFDKCRYEGVFSEAWPRWWMFKVEEAWRSLASKNSTLRGLDARSRVDLLIKKTKLSGLISAEPIDVGYSTKYWTICKGFKKPLDPVDGLLVSALPPEAWQDKNYISIKAALERVGRNDGLKVHPLERDRLSELKEK